MTYADAVAFLDGLTDFERISGYRYDSKAFGPARTRALLDRLGRPEAGFPSAIIAGTKGKGSVSAMLASILDATGLKAGLYTSPHLVSWTERIRVGGVPVTEAEFGGLAGLVAGPVEELEAGGANGKPTAFEVLTAMAVAGFARRGAGAAVLEVGMGGRLDAVNAVDAAAVGITPLSLDHVDQLGTTVEAIAGEKAGVIRGPVPVVCAPQPPGALAVIEAACRAAGAPLVLVGRDMEAVSVESGTAGSGFGVRTRQGTIHGLEIPLAGRHQVVNAMVAIGLARALPFGVSDDAIRRGLASVHWPGRLETVAPGLLVDGAHNGASALVLADAVRGLWAPRRMGLVLAQLRGKDHESVARALVPLAERTWCPSLAHPRALPAGDMAEVARPCGGRVETCADVASALAAARGEYGKPGELVLAAGSLALVGEVMLACSAAWRP